MTYQQFVQELVTRFGEDQGVAMALRAEVGFLRRYLEQRYGEEFIEAEGAAIADFLDRHPVK